jgi:hypothetical protein
MLSYTTVLLGLILSASALPTARQNNNNNAQALQDSLTIDASVVQTTGTGQNPPVDGQSNALVSKNNFANFCALTLANTPITNGLQTTTGSCNPTPIGLIPSSDKMPSAKFQNPKNGDTIAANTAFTISLAVKNIQLGTFTNAQQTYFANPQTLNGQGQIIGHTHVVIESIPSLDTTQVTDPQKFIFFKGINTAQNGQGVVTADVTAGVPAGTYRLGTIMSSATHQPCIVPIAQHGLLDDVVYFTVTAGGAAAGGATGGAAGGAAAGGGNANAGGNGNNNNGGAAAGGGKANAGGNANNGQANNGQANNGQGKGNNGQANNGAATGNNGAAGGAATGGAATGGAATGGAATGGAATGNNAATNTGVGNFGKCSVPQIEFGVGFDQRKETSFQPVDKTSFNHGSAQAIGIITQFICDTLTNSCGADATAKATCTKAQAAAAAQPPKTGADADAFNAAFGITTQFAKVQAIDDQGRPVAGTGNGQANAGGAAAATTTTPAAAATKTAAAAPAATTAAQTGNKGGQGQANTGASAGGNLQKFTGVLGGKAATPVTAGGSKGFVVNGSEFIQLAGALGRSCDEQKNACANVANGSGGKAGFSVSDCETQSTQCRALIST